MLVLSRKPGEKVRIGSDITLEVLEVKGRRVRIGLDAPLHIRIVRAEIYDHLGGLLLREDARPEELLHAVGNP
jgi:carbon storage regulator